MTGQVLLNQVINLILELITSPNGYGEPLLTWVAVSLKTLIHQPLLFVNTTQEEMLLHLTSISHMLNILKMFGQSHMTFVILFLNQHPSTGL